MGDRVSECLDDIDGCVGPQPIVPASDGGIIRSADDDVVLLVVSHSIYPPSVALEFVHDLALVDVGHEDNLVAATRNKARVVVADVEGGDLVVVEVLVEFYEEVFAGIIERDTAIFGARHTVLT